MLFLYEWALLRLPDIEPGKVQDLVWHDVLYINFIMVADPRPNSWT
jgi:hypothetical protein